MWLCPRGDWAPPVYAFRRALLEVTDLPLVSVSKCEHVLAGWGAYGLIKKIPSGGDYTRAVSTVGHRTKV